MTQKGREGIAGFLSKLEFLIKNLPEIITHPLHSF